MEAVDTEKFIALTPYICPKCDIVLMREAVSMEKEIYKQTEEAEFEDLDENKDGYLTVTLTCKRCKGLFRFK